MILASGCNERRDFMTNRVGVVERKLLSIALIMFIRHAVGDGAGPGKADLCDALGVFLGEQKLLQQPAAPRARYFADYPRRVLLGSACSHRNGLAVAASMPSSR